MAQHLPHDTGQRTIGALLFLAVILFGMTVAPVGLERRAFRVSQQMLVSTEPLHESAERIGRAMFELQSSERGYLLTGSRRFLADYRAAGHDLEQALDAAGASASPDDQLLVARVRADAMRWRESVGDPHVDAAVHGQASQALSAEVRGDGDGAFQALQRSTAALSERARARLADESAHRHRLGRIVDASVILLGLAGLVGLGFLVVALRSAQKLRVESERAHEQNRLKDQFLSLVGHEIRTPVTVIRLVTDAIRRHESDAHGHDGWISERLATMQRQVQRIGWLVDELVDVGSVPGGIELQRKETDAVALTHRALAHVRASAPSYPLNFRSDERAARAELDEPRIEQVLAHLVGNAVKFSMRPQPVRVRLEVDVDTLEWTIADQGAGIPRQEQPRLFQRFYRASNAPLSGGLGLGLHLSRMIVTAHGGRIWFESDPGRGTTFHVRVPRWVRPARELPDPAPTAAPELHSPVAH